MRGLNRVTRTGNWGKDPEWRTLEGNISVAKFSLATTERCRDKDGNVQTETEWHSVVAWRNLADLEGRYLRKGSPIYLESKIKTRSYEDKEGIRRYVSDIIAENLIMLDRLVDKAEINASFWQSKRRIAVIQMLPAIFQNNLKIIL